MKKIFFLLTASAAIISCSKVKDGEYLITGTATGVENGKTIILQGQDPTTRMTISLDTVKVENGKFEIKGKVAEPKISGTYSNDEFKKFESELEKVRKKITDFEKNNTAKMQQARQAQDSATVNGLMKQYSELQMEVQADSKKNYITYAETHPKSFISVMIVNGMSQDPTADPKKIESLYNSLDETLKNTTPGKETKTRIGQLKLPSVGASAAPVGSAK